MKSLLLAALVMTSIASVEARSILVFKTVNICQSIKKQDALLIDVQEAQDGQSQLVIKNPLSAEAPLKIQTKKIAPGPKNAGGDKKYVGTNAITKEVVTLQFNGVRPIKVGGILGRSATLKREKLDNVQLICTSK